MSRQEPEDDPSPPRVFAWISIVSERRRPDEISSLLGLRPGSTWRIGDRRANTEILERTHGWIVNSRLSKVGFDVEAHLDDVLQRVKPATEKFALLPEGDIVTVHLAIYSESRILMSFEPHIPRLISLIGARFDVEVYFTPP